MSTIIKGPFEVKWGDNTVTDISEITTDYSVDSEEYQTVDGRTVTIDGAHKISVTIKLLASDIPALAALAPQYFVTNGGVMSTGETVNSATGAIDVIPQACDENSIYNNLDIISCANPGNVMRVVNARTRIESVENDAKVRQVSIIFIGEPQADEAVLQFFTEGTIAVVS